MPAACGAPARAQALRYLLRDLAAGQVGREPAGGGDGAGRARAVGDDHGAAEAEQDRAAVALRVQPGGKVTQPAALEERAETRRPGPGQRRPQLGRGEPDRAFERLERHVSCEAVGHDHVELAGQQVTALDVAREGQREGAVRRLGGQQFVCAPGELVALARLGPDGEQADPRHRYAQRELGVGRSELAELDEHLRLGVRGGTRVDEHGPARAGRQDHGEPGAQHAGQRAQPQPRGRHHAAGGPGRHHRGRVTAPDQLAGHGDAGPRTAQAGQRALVHGEGVLGRHDAELAGRAQPGQRLPQAPGGAGQQDPDAVLAVGRQRARDDLVRRVIAAHRVDGQHGPGWVTARAENAGSGSRVPARGPGCALSVAVG